MRGPGSSYTILMKVAHGTEIHQALPSSTPGSTGPQSFNLLPPSSHLSNSPQLHTLSCQQLACRPMTFNKTEEPWILLLSL